MYWNHIAYGSEDWAQGWIVTLDVLKCLKKCWKQEFLKRWIVTLDVLKFL